MSCSKAHSLSGAEQYSRCYRWNTVPGRSAHWQGLNHWLSNRLLSSLSIGDNSRYSGRTALDEQERRDKAFRGYLSLMWGLLEAPHEVFNPLITKHPNPMRGWFQQSPNLERLARPRWQTATRNYMIPLTPPNIRSWCGHCQLLCQPSRSLRYPTTAPISQVLRSRRATKTKWIRNALIDAFFKIATISNTPCATSCRPISVPPSDLLIDPHIRAP